MNFIQLAEIFEQAATQLREANEKLERIPKLISNPTLLQNCAGWQELCTRARVVLRRNDILTMGNLLSVGPEELLCKKNCGIVTCKEITNFVSKNITPLPDEWQKYAPC